MSRHFFESDAWRVELPESIYGTPAKVTRRDITSMAVLRGEIVPGAPACVIGAVRPMGAKHLRAHVRDISSWLIEGGGEGREVEIPGARGARRVDGLARMDEGLSEDGIERMTIVIASRARDLVSLTVRTRPIDDVAGEVERIVQSFEIR